MALRRKKNSTFVVGMDIVRRKEAQAFVSAGSTGALMAGAMFKIGRIKGIDRPALATLLPVPGRPLLLVDAGAKHGLPAQVDRAVRDDGQRLHAPRDERGEAGKSACSTSVWRRPRATSRRRTPTR